jgi:hypothetical protein
MEKAAALPAFRATTEGFDPSYNLALGSAAFHRAVETFSVSVSRFGTCCSTTIGASNDAKLVNHAFCLVKLLS